MTTRPRRKRKEEIMKAEVESIASKLNMTDDSSHGIKIAAIENKGRGIKVRTRVSILPFCFHHHFFPPLGCEKFLKRRLCRGVLRGTDRHQNC